MAEFTDASLSPRARWVALWLCDLANPALPKRDQAASADLLLRELPDHWTADDAAAMAMEFRASLGPRASHRAWLTAAGWLCGEEERLPARPPQGMSLYARDAAQQKVRSLLGQLTGRPKVVPLRLEHRR